MASKYKLNLSNLFNKDHWSLGTLNQLPLGAGGTAGTVVATDTCIKRKEPRYFVLDQVIHQAFDNSNRSFQFRQDVCDILNKKTHDELYDLFFRRGFIGQLENILSDDEEEALQYIKLITS